MFAFVVAFTKPAVNKEVFVSVVWRKWIRGLFKFRFSVFDPSDSTVAVIKRFLTVTRWFSSCILENFWSLHIFIDNFHPPYSQLLLCFVFICKFKRKSKFFGSICLLSLCQSERDNCTSLQPQFGNWISLQAFSLLLISFWISSA